MVFSFSKYVSEKLRPCMARLASLGIMEASWGPPCNTLDQHSTIVLRGLRGALNWAPIRTLDVISCRWFAHRICCTDIRLHCHKHCRFILNICRFFIIVSRSIMNICRICIIISRYTINIFRCSCCEYSNIYTHREES